MIYRYIGNGEYWDGVPGHDLDDAAIAALTPAQLALVQNGRLYRAERGQPGELVTDQPLAGTGVGIQMPPADGSPAIPPVIVAGEFVIPQGGAV